MAATQYNQPSTVLYVNHRPSITLSWLDLGFLKTPLITGEISSKGRLHKATKKSYLKDPVNLLIRVHHHSPKLPKSTKGNVETSSTH